MTLSSLDFAEPSQSVEMPKQNLGQGGEVGPTADTLQTLEEALVCRVKIMTFAISKQSRGREVIDVSYKFLFVELAQCTAF
jgi:hypothetical protein